MTTTANPQPRNASRWTPRKTALVAGIFYLISFISIPTLPSTDR